MSNNLTETHQSIIAILKNDNKLKAVELFRQNGAFKILWAKSSIENDTDWQTFTAGCGLSTRTASQERIKNNKNVVVGYDSTGTAFYRVDVPAIEAKDLPTIVHLQAESRFPLPADQMELAWRTNNLANNQMAITIAATRKQPVQEFIDKVRMLRPARAILDCEAVITVWKELFSGYEQNAVIINAGTHNMQICLAINGLLCDAVTLDMGTADLGENKSREENEAMERLVRDTKSVMDLFSVEQSIDVPVIILSDGSTIYETLTTTLKSAGLNVRSAIPSIKKLESDNLGLKEIFEYRTPIGLALMGLDGRNNELNLFTYLIKPFGEKVKKHWLYNLQITGTIAAVMLLLFVMISYTVLAGSSKVMNEKLSSLTSQTNIIEKQNLLREIANQRVDILALLTEVNKSGQSSLPSSGSKINPAAQRPNPQPGPSVQSGIELESFHFKRGQVVTITGQAQSKEKLENFEESLLNNKDIRDVHVAINSSTGSTASKNQGGPSGPGGSGNKGFSFTITFHYKNFTGSKSK
jgi:hypothetical protein